MFYLPFVIEIDMTIKQISVRRIEFFFRKLEKLSNIIFIPPNIILFNVTYSQLFFIITTTKKINIDILMMVYGLVLIFFILMYKKIKIVNLKWGFKTLSSFY